ncbi:MAG TPA: type II secretion system F family protein [Abditibacterium sp.]
MAVFTYVAKDQAGKIHRGRIEAPNEKMLQKRLQDQGFWVQSLAAEGAGKKKKFNPLKAMQKIKMQQISIFCRQFATMINAGVSLVRCLSVLEKQTTNTKLKDIIRDTQNRVEAGETLSRAMSHHPAAFSNLTLGLVRAGEVGGVLDETLERLAQFMESDIRMRQKIKAAMTYPVLVGIVAVVIVVFLVTFIVPKFLDIFKDFKVEMPPMTLALISVSNFMTNPRSALPLVLGIVGFFVAFKKFKSTKWGKRIYDKYKMKVPVFGKLSHNIAVERFCRTLSTLLTSGVPILQALETVSAAIDNETFTDVIMNARARIREGDPIGDPLEKSKLFPPMVVQMISIGEETGALDQMLGKVADFYAVEVETQLEQLAATIEPLMIVGLGLVVGFIVIAMFMPMIALINNLSGGNDE